MKQSDKKAVIYYFLVGLILVSGQQKVFYRLTDPLKTFRYLNTTDKRLGSPVACALFCSIASPNCNSFFYFIDEIICRCGGWGWIGTLRTPRNVSNEQVFWAPICHLVDTYKLESNEVETNCLWFSNHMENYTTAAKNCADIGLQLLTLKTTQKLTFFKRIASRYVVDQAWIGLDDQDVEDTFLWVDETPLGYDIFGRKNGSDQPNNIIYGEQDQDCVAYLEDSKSFNDDHCASKKRYVCGAVIS